MSITRREQEAEAAHLLSVRTVERLRDIRSAGPDGPDPQPAPSESQCPAAPSGGDGPRPHRTDAGRLDHLREVLCEHYVRQMSPDEQRDLVRIRDGKLRVVGGDDGRRFRCSH